VSSSAESSDGKAVGVELTPAAEPKGFGGKLLFWLPWPILVVADLWSKHAVFAFMYQEGVPEVRVDPHVVFSGSVNFELVTWGNTGTVWGLFQDGTVVLMVLRCFALIGLLWFVRTTSRSARLQLTVLSLVFAGAVGNLYDNFVRADRSVRDFLHFSGDWPWKWDFPAFNVADSCITVGAIGLFVLLWREDRSQSSRDGKNAPIKGDPAKDTPSNDTKVS
jgi:signal peptidase II